eukprot:403363417
MDKDIELQDQQYEKPLVRKETESSPKSALNKLSSDPPKQILWGKALIGAGLWGASNFFYGLLDDQDFGVTCLSCTGFITTSLIWKAYELSRTPNVNKSVIFESFFGEMKKKGNIFHVIFRSVNFFTLIWLTIIISDFSSRADINFGVVFSILCLSVVIQAIVFALFFGEKLSKSLIIGIMIVLSGVVMISVSKSTSTHIQPIADSDTQQINDVNSSKYDDNQKLQYKLLAIGLAIFAAFINSLRVIQAKFLNKQSGYCPIQFSVDSSLTSGVFLLICSIFFFFNNHASYTMHNLTISFIGSVLLQICSLVSLQATVHGIGAPASALLNTHSIFCTILIIIFKGQIPNMYQFMGMGLTIGGVFCILFLKSCFPGSRAQTRTTK